MSEVEITPPDARPIKVSAGCFGPAFWICLTILVLAFAGEPDLMDAVIGRIGR